MSGRQTAPRPPLESLVRHPLRLVLAISTAAVAIGAIALAGWQLQAGSPQIAESSAAMSDQSGLTEAPEAPSWRAVGMMVDPQRIGHTVTLLEDGRVLVVGATGSPDGANENSAELFHPVFATWTEARAPRMPDRRFHSATLLTDGRVLVAGGVSGEGEEMLSSTQIYDPASNSWSPTGNMRQARASHAAARLADGRVLVASGSDQRPTDAESVEIYDPATGTWSTAASMLGPRIGLSLTTLGDGRVLAVASSRAEVYTPESGTWDATGPLVESRGSHVAVLLADGTVLVAGGGRCCQPTASAEIFDPTNGTWAATGSMNEPRGWFTGSLLADGTVLVTGSGNGGFVGVASTERYDPESRTWSPAEPMNRDRSEHQAVVLADGRVLVVGGYPGRPDPMAEVYGPVPDVRDRQTTGDARSLPALRMPPPLPGGPIEEYGWTSRQGSTWMHNVTGVGQQEITFAIRDGCFTTPAGENGLEPIQMTIAGLVGSYAQPFDGFDAGIFISGVDDTWTTRAHSFDIDGRALCVYLSWDPMTTPAQLAAAYRVLGSLRGEVLDDGAIRIVFTAPGDWDTG